MKITVLVENTVPKNLEKVLECEHGLSLHISVSEMQILLDAGMSEKFSDNAKKLGVELEKIQWCVLSHGHYDHAGGLEALFQQNKKTKAVAQKSAMHPYYSGNGGMHPIGIPENVLRYKERFELVEGFAKLQDGIVVVPHNTKHLEEIGARTKLYQEKDGELVPDDFCHEQSLVVDTDQGLVIFNSCSHGGVANIVREVKEACNQRPIYAYVGGLHMKGTVNGEEICTFSEEELDELCDFILQEDILHIYTGHCVGLPGLEKMRKRLGDRIHSLTTGLVFTL